MIQLLAIELTLVLIFAFVACLAPRLGSAWFGRMESRLNRLARRKPLALAVVGLAALAAGAVPRLFEGLPRPQIHDEFSYLLAGDTFSHGRLTNPTHPFWQHFESFHISQQPTYMSMYPPAQGMILALGKRLFGHPWFGIWIATAILCVAICWMLQGWLPPGWALAGGLIAVIRIATYSYWIGSYWGGSIAGAAGAAILGALPRLMRHRHWRDSLLLGLGVAVVLNARPFEGLALAVPVAGTLAWWMRRTGLPAAAKAFAPMLSVLGLAAMAMLYYNWRITGDPLLMPFAANRARYAVANHFVWQTANPIPHYHHAVMRDFYLGWELTGFNNSRGWAGFEGATYEKVLKGWLFFIGPALTIALFPLARVIGDRRLRPLLVIGAVSAAILSVSVYFSPHYAAPYTALIFAVLLQGLRHVRTWSRRGQPVGVALTRAVAIVCLLMIGFRAAALPLKLSVAFDVPTWCSNSAPDYQREALIANLKRLGGRHLVIVRYAPGHVPLREWVYNDADIDAAPIVWTREMDTASNARLIRYFAGRQVWLFEPDRDLLKFTAYPQ